MSPEAQKGKRLVVYTEDQEKALRQVVSDHQQGRRNMSETKEKLEKHGLPPEALEKAIRDIVRMYLAKKEDLHDLKCILREPRNAEMLPAIHEAIGKEIVRSMRKGEWTTVLKAKTVCPDTALPAKQKMEKAFAEGVAEKVGTLDKAKEVADAFGIVITDEARTAIEARMVGSARQGYVWELKKDPFGIGVTSEIQSGITDGLTHVLDTHGSEFGVEVRRDFQIPKEVFREKCAETIVLALKDGDFHRAKELQGRFRIARTKPEFHEPAQECLSKLLEHGRANNAVECLQTFGCEITPEVQAAAEKGIGKILSAKESSGTLIREQIDDAKKIIDAFLPSGSDAVRKDIEERIGKELACGHLEEAVYAKDLFGFAEARWNEILETEIVKMLQWRRIEKGGALMIFPGNPERGAEVKNRFTVEITEKMREAAKERLGRVLLNETTKAKEFAEIFGISAEEVQAKAAAAIEDMLQAKNLIKAKELAATFDIPLDANRMKTVASEKIEDSLGRGLIEHATGVATEYGITIDPENIRSAQKKNAKNAVIYHAGRKAEMAGAGRFVIHQPADEKGKTCRDTLQKFDFSETENEEVVASALEEAFNENKLDIAIVLCQDFRLGADVVHPIVERTITHALDNGKTGHAEKLAKKFQYEMPKELSARLEGMKDEQAKAAFAKILSTHRTFEGAPKRLRLEVVQEMVTAQILRDIAEGKMREAIELKEIFTVPATDEIKAAAQAGMTKAIDIFSASIAVQARAAFALED